MELADGAAAWWEDEALWVAFGVSLVFATGCADTFSRWQNGQADPANLCTACGGVSCASDNCCDMELLLYDVVIVDYDQATGVSCMADSQWTEWSQHAGGVTSVDADGVSGKRVVFYCTPAPGKSAWIAIGVGSGSLLLCVLACCLLITWHCCCADMCRPRYYYAGAVVNSESTPLRA